MLRNEPGQQAGKVGTKQDRTHEVLASICDWGTVAPGTDVSLLLSD